MVLHGPLYLAQVPPCLGRHLGVSASPRWGVHMTVVRAAARLIVLTLPTVARGLSCEEEREAGLLVKGTLDVTPLPTSGGGRRRSTSPARPVGTLEVPLAAHR